MPQSFFTILTHSVPNIIAFAVSLGYAYYYHWQTADLVWSLWISSLVFGYVIFVVYAVRLLGAQGVRTLPKVLRLLLFFSVHFGLFHLVQAQFLSNWFPLKMSLAPEYVIAHFIPTLEQIYQQLLSPYSVFILSTLLSHYHFLSQAQPLQNPQKIMVFPYKNVIKMHLMLFVFALAFTWGISGFILTVVVYSVYFLPLKELKLLQQLWR